MLKNKLLNLDIAIGIAIFMLFISAILSFSFLLIGDETFSIETMFLLTRIVIVASCILTFWLYGYVFNETFNYLKIVGSLFNASGIVSLAIGILFILMLIRQHPQSATSMLFIVGFFLTSVSEEFLFRGLVEFQLSKSFKPYQTILLQAFIFAFIGHQSFDMEINLLIRFPLGIILSVLRRKTQSYMPPIMLHFVYDTVMDVGA